MIILLFFWGIANLFALLAFINYMRNTDCWFNYFVYPLIDEWLDKENMSLFGKWVVFIIINIFFLPAFVVYYTIFTIYLLFALAIYLLVEWRRHRKQKR
jgi:hypothetical protein